MDNNNDSSFKPFVNKTKDKKKGKQKNKNQNTSLFMSKTFASKLFLKLTSKIIDPIIVCLQTLKFEPENRRIEEIENTIPYLKTLYNFNDFIKFRESEKSSFDLMVKFARITFYQYYRKNTILKKPGSSNDKFYIILNGSINKYSLIFEKQNLTLEQYMLYLIEMIIINEDEIIKRCHILNQTVINTGKDENSIMNFIKSSKLKLKEIQSKAEKELSQLGFNNNLFHSGLLKRVSSIENYLKIFENVSPKIAENDGKPKFNLWIGKYKLSSILAKGGFFNNISEEKIKEYNLYICKTNCDIGQIERDEFCNAELNLCVQLKMKNIFREIKNKFYFLRGMEDDKFVEKYSHYILYKKYKKGDKIFLQGSLYEGVYFVYDGEIELSTKTNIDKLGQLLINIVYSIKSFPEHIPVFNSVKLIEEFNNKHQLLYSKGDIPFIEFLKTKTILISKIKNNDILGLSESYDYKTELFNFTAECISDEVTAFFITKNDFNLMLARETTLKNTILPIVEYKIQFIVGKLRSFSEQTLKLFEQNYKKFKPKKTNSTSNIFEKSTSTNNINSNLLNNSINNNSIYTNKSSLFCSNNDFNKSKLNNNFLNYSLFNSSHNNSIFNNNNNNSTIFKRNKNDKNRFDNSKCNNSSSFTIKTNLSLRNYRMSPFLLENPFKEKENIGKMSLNKINYEPNYNKNNSGKFYKALKARRINSNFNTDFMKYSSSNDINFQNQIDNNNYINKYNSFFDKNIKNFNSTQTKLLYNDNIINSFRSTKMNKFINNNIIPLSNYNNYEGARISPSYNKKFKKLEKVELLPKLKNRLLNNSKSKNKKKFM